MMLKTLAYIVCYLIYPFSFLFPRKKKRWAFGSFRGAFNDNAKYLFIYANEHCPDRETAWVSANRDTVAQVRSLGYKAYRSTSLKGALYALTSKYWFYNSYTSDIMFCLSGGATCVNLWHGVGLKRIEFNSVSGPLADRYVRKRFREVFFHPEAFRRPDIFLSPSAFQTVMFSKAFRIPESRCIEAGYPRNEVLLRPVDVSANPFKGYRKVYIYMPTWRDSQREVFVQHINLGEIDSVLGENNGLLLLKPHANTIIREEISDFPHIRLLPSGMDVYPILPFTDVLITDYSSVLYDYILMPGKGVVLYLYDYADYVKDRDFYYPFDGNVIGERAYDFNEMLAILQKGIPALNEKERCALVNKFWGKSDLMNSCRQILDGTIEK